MDFSFSEEQVRMRTEVRAFAERELNNDVLRRDHEGVFDRVGWDRLARYGILGLPIPELYGGQGQDVVTTLSAMEGLGQGSRDGGLLLAVGAHIVICEIPIWQFGSEEQKRRFLPKLCAGESIGAYGLTEPNAGSDAFGLETLARRDGDHYLLNGTKTFITNGPIADVVVVFATVDRAAKARGITAFIVEKGMPGFHVSRELDKMGLRTSPTGELVFEDCRVPVANRIGPEGGAAAILGGCLEWERACLLGSSIGAMEHELDLCVRYARERIQFGKPIAEFQAIQHKLADMKVRLETSRWMIYRVAWAKQNGHAAPMDAAIAKLYISECRLKNALEAIQIHGGYGYMREFEVERHLRDIIPGTIGAGTSEIQRNLIAKHLLK
ncbi:MAG: acyl-CoA dehydrogenase family protein [Deltaproteobacteria bacterium]|nr:acyl-CoA dehydrogenase family protein [Deltaproteobacteria bacterium]